MYARSTTTCKAHVHAKVMAAGTRHDVHMRPTITVSSKLIPWGRPKDRCIWSRSLGYTIQLQLTWFRTQFGEYWTMRFRASFLRWPLLRRPRNRLPPSILRASKRPVSMPSVSLTCTPKPPVTNGLSCQLSYEYGSTRCCLQDQADLMIAAG